GMPGSAVCSRWCQRPQKDVVVGVIGCKHRGGGRARGAGQDAVFLAAGLPPGGDTPSTPSVAFPGCSRPGCCPGRRVMRGPAPAGAGGGGGGGGGGAGGGRGAAPPPRQAPAGPGGGGGWGGGPGGGGSRRGTGGPPRPRCPARTGPETAGPRSPPRRSPPAGP